MKKIFAVSFLILVVSEAAHAQKFSRERHSYTSEAADQVVIKELQREILENVQSGRQNRRLTGKEARKILKQYKQLTSREIKLYRKKRLNERKLAVIRTDLEDLVQELYSTVRFDKGEKGGWVRAKRY